MSLLSMYYDLLFITVSVRFIVVSGMDETTQTKDGTIDNLVRLQSLDRGDFAKPKIDREILSSMSLDALDKLVQEAHVELKCSYLYFAMLHLHIIETYMANLMNLINLSVIEKDSIVCTEESATILALVHDQDGKGWKDIRSVMWIFHMFAEKTANFLRPILTELQAFNGNSVVYAYNAVKVLLGEFSSTNGCKAYNPANGTLEDYTDRLDNIVFGGRVSTRQKALENKKRFKTQTEHNAQSGWVARDTYRFSIDHLHINNMLYNEQIMEELRTFGLPNCWEKIVSTVKILNEGAIKGTMFLNEYIRSLKNVQLEYIHMMEILAVQVVVKQLFFVEMKMGTMSMGELVPYAYRNCNDIGKEIARHLTLFAEHFRLVDDRNFSQIIDFTSSSYLHMPCLIEHCLFNLLLKLNVMYPQFGIDFRYGLMASENDYITRSTTDILAISRENDLGIDFNMVNPVLVQVYVEYIKKITSTIDFSMIDSFIQFTASSVFERFTKIEKEVVNKHLQSFGIASSPLFDRGARP